MQDPGQAASGRKWWKRAGDGETVYRLVTPVVFWWAWVVFAVVLGVQALITDHEYSSFELAAGLAAVTAAVYATALRPKVIADDDGLHVRNPFRDHRIGWGGLNSVSIGDSVELSCAQPAPRNAKTIYCWAVYSGRRSRLRAERSANRNPTSGLGGGFGISSRAPAEAQDLAKRDAVQVVAAAIDRRSADERQRGAPAAVLESAWAWWPLAFLLASAAALLGLVLAR